MTSVCQHVDGKCVALSIPDHGSIRSGALKRRVPIGGLANGIPSQVRTWWSCVEFNVRKCESKPRTRPEFVERISGSLDVE